MPEPRAATTVLLLRPDPGGLSLFMVQRHRKSGFMPSAWVFPGGRVDEADGALDRARVLGGERVAGAMGLSHEQAVPYLIAGVRETFEEAGIWLGSGDLPQDLRGPLNRGERSLAEVMATHDAVIDLDRLLPWSWWVTPEPEPRRYDTRFIVAIAEPAETRGRHDDVETVDSGWFAPQALLDGRFPMAPPTWWTLQEMATLGTIDAVREASWTRPALPIEPILRLGDGTVDLLLPGHPEHPQRGMTGLPAVISFNQGRWRAKQSGG